MRRSGLTLIELIATSLILSIMAAVVVPTWIDYQQNIHASSAALAVSADIRAIQRHAAHSSQSFTITINTGTSVMNVNPAIPKLIGDTNGDVDYSQRYRGFLFDSTGFSGTTFDINMQGELVDSSTNTAVPNRNVSVRLGQNLVNVQLQSSILPSASIL